MTQLPFTYDFDDPNLVKPWLDLEQQDKYFNYGFTEQTWRVYASSVLNQ
jgi:hypothetical protein